MSKHTKGPWKIGINNTNALTILGAENVNKYGNIIAVCSEKQYQNARLIAAAPEMLEVLKMIEATVSRLDPSMTDGYSWKHLNAIREVIAKADGNAK